MTLTCYFSLLKEALEKHPAGAETEHEKVPSVEQVEAETEAVGGGAETEQADAEAETEEDGAGAETEQVGAEVETEQEKGPSAGAQEAERSDSAHTRTSSSFNGASDSGQFEALQPRPNFRELGDSEYPSKVWDDWESFERSRVYYKKKKGAGSGLDDEYEMDETDHAWLELVNELVFPCDFPFPDIFFGSSDLFPFCSAGTWAPLFRQNCLRFL